MRYTRITANPNQMGGMPCLRGLRIPVATVINMIADGMNSEEILNAFPDLEPEDITEALRYADEAAPWPTTTSKTSSPPPSPRTTTRNQKNSSVDPRFIERP
jgi:uncharacterized protein (DUF433 family)